jgi:UDP-sugar transporter A1/2/3
MLKLLLRVFLFSVGSVCYALLGILSQLSKSQDGSYAYSMPSVVLTAEAVKLCLSVAFLWRESDSQKRFWVDLCSGSLADWLSFSVPALLYAINNILDMENNQHMDPATEQVLVQLKILTTGIAWRIVFRMPLGARKWLSLVFLFAGAACAAWPSPSGSKAKTMHIDSIGFLLVFIYVWISAIAGVYNEWLYKRVDASGKCDNFHVCNIRLYIMGCCCHLLFHVSNTPGHPIFGLFHGYNRYTWGLVATYAMMGLLLSQVMKYFDNIVKLFISGSSMYVSAALSWLIFSIEPTSTFMLGLVIVSIALVMYNAERIFTQPKEKA